MDLGDGFLTLSNVQNVTGTADFDTFCADQAPIEACGSPVGVAEFSPNGLAVLAQQGWSQSHYVQPSKYAIVEFNTSTLENVSYLHIDCQPGFPFYPGVGATVWVPCFNASWSHNSTVLGYDGLTGAIDANITFPIWPYVMSYDSRSSEIYAFGWSLSGPSLDFAGFNTSSPEPVASEVPALQISETQDGGTAPFALDPSTGEIVFGSANSTLMELDPATGDTAVIAELPSSPLVPRLVGEFGVPEL
ncbi:MAG: hypothetical protein ACLP8Y_02345 [Thermoplasmata archaeon]